MKDVRSDGGGAPRARLICESGSIFFASCKEGSLLAAGLSRLCQVPKAISQHIHAHGEETQE